jgi:diguanylate cyclase (GGDEF)-like protein
VFDLNGFGEINNQYSWAVGDELIKVLAARVRAAFPRQEDVRGHLMGDEFAIYLVGLTDPVKAVAMAEALLASLKAPIVTSAATHTVAAAIGLVVTPAQGIMTPSTSTQFRRGEVAEKLAKRAGGAHGGVWLWKPGDPERVEDIPAEDAPPAG